MMDRGRKQVCILVCIASIILIGGYIAGAKNRFIEICIESHDQHTNKPIDVIPSTTPKQEVIPSTTPKQEVNCTIYREETKEYSDCMTLLYVKQYGSKLMGQTLPVKVDPRNMSTVTEWWEAAALIAWHMSGPVHFKCKNIVRIQDWGVCQDPPMTVQQPCLVYSFGINYNFAFDDLMGKIGCEVHSFDPSMNKGDHKHSQNVTFYKMGLGGEDTDDFKPARDAYVHNDQKWKMHTLDGIVKMLGHEKRNIDVVKIDIETSEWPTLHNMLATDAFKRVRHFLVEYHLFNNRPSKSNYVGYVQDFRKLVEMGFRTYYKFTHNIVETTKSYNFQGEVYYYNTKMAAGG